MRRLIAVFIWGITLTVATGFGVGHAVAAPEAPVAKELPQSGDLAASLSGGFGRRQLEEPWGGVDERGEDRSPITGSISKRGTREWVMRVFNNSAEPYSVQLQVNMFGRTGGKTKSDTFSYTLKPQSSVERTLVAPTGTEEARLSLLGWKNLAPKVQKDGTTARGGSSSNTGKAP